jgi:glycerol transport system ATP-binding protein
MQLGEVVQVGSPVELFERPRHTFVGHFIGSPGMNVLPCELRDGGAFFNGRHVPVEGPVAAPQGSPRLEIGVRPEFIRFAPTGVPVDVVKVSDVGRYRIVETRAGDARINLLAADQERIPEGPAHLAFDPARTRVYADGWLLEG